MATVSGTFIFALPEDEDTDQMLIKSATTKEGTYSTDVTVSYEYGTLTYEYDALDTTKWYKIQFNNSTDAEAGPDSDPVYGGDFSQASPFLAVSTGTDGAQYATVQDLYDYSHLTTADVSVARAEQALRRARAIIDYKTADLNLDRFLNNWDSDIARKKHNAVLRIVREAEINIALGNIYRGLSDDLVTKRIRETRNDASLGSSSISVGQTSLTSSGGIEDIRHMNQLRGLANRYLAIGASLIHSLQPTSVRMSVETDYGQSPKFRFPFNGWS